MSRDSPQKNLDTPAGGWSHDLEVPMEIRNPPTMEAYSRALRQSGVGACCYINGQVWLTMERFAMQRLPSFVTIRPSPHEVDRVLRQTRRMIAEYVVEPSPTTPANALLYLFPGRTYDPGELATSVRRNIKRARKALDLAFFEPSEVLEGCYPAYHDTRTRVGLSDGTATAFRSRFVAFLENPYHHVLGARFQGQIAAFATLIVVDEGVEIEGLFSRDAFLKWRPNDGLMSRLLNLFVNDLKAAAVSYGLSSVQTPGEESEDGLHRFKTKVGFDAQPVSRCFVVRNPWGPVIALCAPPVLKLARALAPKNRFVRKAEGVTRSLRSVRK